MRRIGQTVRWWMEGAPGRQERKKYFRLYEQGEFEEAALALRDALTAAPNDSELTLQVANLSRFGLLPLEDALPLLRNVISKAPPALARRALIQLFNLLWERKGAETAMAWFPHLVRESEKSPRLLLRAAALANEARHTTEAFALLARVGRSDPSALASMGYVDLILAAADAGAAELPQAPRARTVADYLSRFEGRFAEMTAAVSGNVAVVANGPSLLGARLGGTIDSHQLVARFNNHAAMPGSVDLGERTDIWFRPAEFTHVPRCETPAVRLIALTGCNIRNRYSNGLQLLEPHVQAGLPVELVPTRLYRHLFAALDASPSAGLIGLAWVQGEIGRKLSPGQVFGYSLERNTSAVSHYYGKRHTGSWPSRHNWQAEQAFFQSLMSEVISA
ncbi:glycosyltransferase family 29 protein [Ciceribacter sp. RN22]|uniref:glycosyltransferase family 29 protein n=1 Tax=Ciceribacter sp. RN22 TaxID=2954932 RepID=UPI00209321EC|nr:glycosyltransferase family 29 protein [Ciceribacter sp. RN22]MCO6179011.1 glycosyltransferase family 29 protein [Ciceribacter sp. RN22]